MNYLWIPAVMLAAAVGAYVANLSNTGVAYGKAYVVLASFMITLSWLWVTCVSRNLVFDSPVFDLILAVVFTSVLIYLQGQGHSFTLCNWMGLVLCVLGLILFKR